MARGMMMMFIRSHAFYILTSPKIQLITLACGIEKHTSFNDLIDILMPSKNPNIAILNYIIIMMMDYHVDIFHIVLIVKFT